MATLRDSLATISRISWLWNFSIFFTSWAWSVLYTKQTKSSVTLIHKLPSECLYLRTTRAFIGSARYSFSAARLNSSQVWYCGIVGPRRKARGGKAGTRGRTTRPTHQLTNPPSASPHGHQPQQGPLPEDGGAAAHQQLVPLGGRGHPRPMRRRDVAKWAEPELCPREWARSNRALGDRWEVATAPSADLEDREACPSATWAALQGRPGSSTKPETQRRWRQLNGDDRVQLSPTA